MCLGQCRTVAVDKCSSQGCYTSTSPSAPDTGASPQRNLPAPARGARSQLRSAPPGPVCRRSLGAVRCGAARQPPVVEAWTLENGSAARGRRDAEPDDRVH